MPLTPAKSQKAEDCPISFILEVDGVVKKKTDLFIRPEEFSVSFPSRTTVNQTLGGAWIDSFGLGLETTSLAGTLGWRTGPDGYDGTDRLGLLKRDFYTAWHEERAKAINQGLDPNTVKLRYVDTLNRFARVVAPQVFELRRSKSQPLLAKYRFSFVSVGKASLPTATVPGGGALGKLTGWRAGLASLLKTIGKITDAIKSVKNFVDRTILGPVRAFMAVTGQILTAVHDVIAAGRSIADSLINVARDITQVGLNVFRTLASIASIPQQIKASLMEVAGAFSNAFCVLRNALKKVPTYEDYNALYGASNCSSTSGGRPASLYADKNALAAVSESTKNPVVVTQPASAAMQNIATRDVVLNPMTVPDLGRNLAEINAGVVLR